MSCWKWLCTLSREMRALWWFRYYITKVLELPRPVLSSPTSDVFIRIPPTLTQGSLYSCRTFLLRNTEWCWNFSFQWQKLVLFWVKKTRLTIFLFLAKTVVSIYHFSQLSYHKHNQEVINFEGVWLIITQIKCVCIAEWWASMTSSDTDHLWKVNHISEGNQLEEWIS